MASSPIRLAEVRTRLADRATPPLTATGSSYAAVALVLAEPRVGAEVLMIRRAERAGDPWSGQMAFPGGRQTPEESDLFTTAQRETHEEVGIDLSRHGELIGVLDDIHAVSDRPVNLVIRPYVCELTTAVATRPNRREVATTVWVPLAQLRRPESRGVYRHALNRHAVEFPAFVYQGFTIWGLTYRMLSSFLDLIA